MYCLIIMKKELLENLLNLKFILSLGLIVALFVVNSLVFVDEYKQDNEVFWRETNHNLSSLNEKANNLWELTFHKQNIWQKPSFLSFCVEGFEKNLPNLYRMNTFVLDYPEVVSRSNFLSTRFRYPDYTFIVSCICSVVAIFLTFDTICGERENGTLRLTMSYAVPRQDVLFGKYLGAMLSLILPLILGILLSIIIMAVVNIESFETGYLVRISLFLILSVLYLSLFTLCGILISTIIKHAVGSVLIGLLLWVLFVILIPCGGRVISMSCYPIPTLSEIERKQEETYRKITDQAYAGKFGPKPIASSQNRKADYVNPPARGKYIQTITGEWNRIFKNHLNLMVSQTRNTLNVLRVSPTILYQQAAETITGTGLHRSVNVLEQIMEYQANFMEYVRTKDLDDGDSFHEIFNSPPDTKNWQSISTKPVDYDGIPKFHEQPESIIGSLRTAIWDIGILFLFNFVMFAACFVSFLRYDVR